MTMEMSWPGSSPTPAQKLTSARGGLRQQDEQRDSEQHNTA